MNIFLFLILTQKCNTSSKSDGVILNQFLIEISESNADETQNNSEFDSKVIIQIVLSCCIITIILIMFHFFFS